MIEAPNLDDRSFQELVDEAKRYIAERCEGWTDHNVSDPGVTLVEAFAWMTDTLLYRLNRVPERMYLKFLEMIGLSLGGPTAAAVDVDFRLSASLAHDLTIPADTVVSTEQTAANESLEFSLLDEQIVRSAQADCVLKIGADQSVEDITGFLGFGSGFEVFQALPAVNDGLYFGFPVALDRHLVLVAAQVDEIAGHSIDPDDPPLRWQISGASDWLDCELVGSDATSGFNETGQIELALPSGHRPVQILDAERHWLRCVVVDHPKPYRSSPKVADVTVSSIGLVARCVHGAPVTLDHLGQSTGVAGQEFGLSRHPVVSMPGEELAIIAHRSRVSQNGDRSADIGAGMEDGHSSEWVQVDNFADSEPDDRHFVLEPMTGIVRFGPEVREPDGTVRRYGAVPERGWSLVASRYLTGGGRAGNVVPGAIQNLRSSVPHVSKVRNRAHGLGGIDAETIDQARKRGPLELRARNRAVTAEDYEYLASGSSSEISRVKCLRADDIGPAAVRLLVLPMIPERSGTYDLVELDPSPQLLERVAARMERVRMVGSMVRVEPPRFHAVRVEAVVQARPTATTSGVREAALAALHRYFNPAVGGDEGDGWPFGRGARIGQAIAAIQQCPGVDVVEELTMFAVQPTSEPPERWGPGTEVEDGIELHPNELIISAEHQVEVYHPEE